MICIFMFWLIFPNLFKDFVQYYVFNYILENRSIGKLKYHHLVFFATFTVI